VVAVMSLTTQTPTFPSNYNQRHQTQDKKSPTPENTAPVSTTAMAEPTSGRSGPSMPAMPKYHGTLAPTKGSIRHRWRTRDKKRAETAAANEGAIEHSKACDDSFSDSDWVSSPPSPREKHAEQVHVPGHAQSRVASRSPEQKEYVGYWLQLTPSPPGGAEPAALSKPTEPAAPSRNTKPVLTAFSTSAEIVDAIMPDCPAVGSLPRRTVSLHLASERERPLPRRCLISRPA
jgi:hypothetical protein